MTAAGGIIHEEFHSADFTREGGTLEMVQLWVNLPAKDKMAPPNYQTLLDGDIPAVALPDGAGTARIIAGEFDGKRGPARSFTPMNVWDLRLTAGKKTRFSLNEGDTLALAVLHGAVKINDSEYASEARLVVFDRAGTDIGIEAESDATLLLLSGEPIDEPIVGYGPFVMNSRAEIVQAIDDFNSGKFGQLEATSNSRQT
jgi:quercetin 2,3-dioxygenase